MLSELDAEFRPDWASPPGSTIARALSRSAMSAGDLATRLEVSELFIENLIFGQQEIDEQLAAKLAAVLGSTQKFWLAREHAYRGAVVRLHKKSSADLTREWLETLPLGDMEKFGWIKPAHRAHRFVECMRFFGVSSIDEWKRRYESTILSVAFRTSLAFDTNPAAVAAWLRIGEIRAQAIECAKWNATAFQESLSEIRKLTRVKDPASFLPELQKICALSGVAVVVARSPSGCRASGAARFLKSQRAVIQLSVRHASDDHFWFSFFHEAGHILLHEKIGLFLDGFDGLSNAEEDEANSFAAEVLLDASLRDELKRIPINYRDVIRFALRAGVSAGIVVGQLQHAGRVKPSWLNKVRRRYSWDQFDS